MRRAVVVGLVGVLASFWHGAECWALSWGQSAPIAQPEPPPAPASPERLMECSLKLRALAMAVQQHAAGHEGKTPPDLASVLRAGISGTKPDGAIARDAAVRGVVSPAHTGLLKVPQDVNDDWVNERSSYRYLPGAAVPLGDVPEWGEVVVAHLRLDQGHAAEPTPENPEGQVFTLAFMDGHVETLPLAEAQRRIVRSMEIFEALQTGRDMPDDHQCLRDLSLIARAVEAYAKAHEGRLPPTLGAVLEFVPHDGKRLATSAQRASIFLSPKARRGMAIPETPAPEWIDAHGSYVYIGHAEVRFDNVPEPTRLVLVHGRLSDAYQRTRLDGTNEERVPTVTLSGDATMRSRRESEWIVDQTRRTIASLHTEAPMPDWVHASRDLRELGRALRRYAGSNGDAFPPDLSATLGRISDDGSAEAPWLAGVYSSPRAQAASGLPASLSPEWVRANGNYVYLGNDRLIRRDALDGSVRVLLHGPLDESYDIVVGDTTISVVPFVDPFGSSMLGPKEWLQRQIAESREAIKRLSAGKP